MECASHVHHHLPAPVVRLRRRGPRRSPTWSSPWTAAGAAPWWAVTRGKAALRREIAGFEATAAACRAETLKREDDKASHTDKAFIGARARSCAIDPLRLRRIMAARVEHGAEFVSRVATRRLDLDQPMRS